MLFRSDYCYHAGNFFKPTGVAFQNFYRIGFEFNDYLFFSLPAMDSTKHYGYPRYFYFHFLHPFIAAVYGCDFYGSLFYFPKSKVSLSNSRARHPAVADLFHPVTAKHHGSGHSGVVFFGDGHPRFHF